MRQLVKGLLDYSRIGRQKIKNPIDCNLLFNELKSELSYIISENNATIHIEQTLPTINGYKTEIRLLFANLLTNAIKFKKAGIPPEIKISVKNKKRYWVFSVSDNGIGIDEEYQKKIFIIFQRLHARNLYKGTGIGLAHCQKIANMHEGEIWVKSTPNIGSTFYVSLLKQPL
jgi:light-regulated signal transduction histidine kinase (bacteriophytochrome)